MSPPYGSPLQILLDAAVPQALNGFFVELKSPRSRTTIYRRRRVGNGRNGLGRLLRPVRLRDRFGSLPPLEAAARRASALLQRALRLLRSQPIRRRRAELGRLEDLHLGTRHGARD